MTMMTLVSSRFREEVSESAPSEPHQSDDRVGATIEQAHSFFYVTRFQKEKSSFCEEENSR